VYDSPVPTYKRCRFTSIVGEFQTGAPAGRYVTAPAELCSPVGVGACGIV
jgi:hypothetical protein